MTKNVILKLKLPSWELKLVKDIKDKQKEGEVIDEGQLASIGDIVLGALA